MEEKKEMSLAQARDRIDQIDRKLVSLFRERMDVMADVAAVKKKEGKPVLDLQREREKLLSVDEMAGPIYGSYARTLYSTVMSLARANQHRLLDGDGQTKKAFEAAVASTDSMFPERATVACQGVEGAFSQHAADKLFALPQITYYSNFSDVFNAVANGTCRYGVLPLENSTSGSVEAVFEQMTRQTNGPFYIVRSVRLKVDHNLMGIPGSSLDHVRLILSHEQALSQCGAYLRNKFPGVELRACTNTAEAARIVAAEKDPGVLALASSDSASQYGLKILEADVQDNANNYTRFICISRKLEVYPGSGKTSIVLVAEHRPGSLSRVLARFEALQINLTKLESRPVPGHDFEFMFYFDLDCPMYAPRLTQLFNELEQDQQVFRYLGTYTEIL
ncbi:MAG: chorismate mutase [Clostridia bacterium]|nr:chorismate mutase [Clostridia bacterium]